LPDPPPPLAPPVLLPELPPEGAPPVIEPPVELPPVELPPVIEPPVELPPVELPPVELPPEGAPPVIEPPVELPPVIEPPVALPPVELPPVTLPPVALPPAALPPVELPPVVFPAADTPPVAPPVEVPPELAEPAPAVELPPVAVPAAAGCGELSGKSVAHAPASTHRIRAEVCSEAMRVPIQSQEVIPPGASGRSRCSPVGILPGVKRVLAAAVDALCLTSLWSTKGPRMQKNCFSDAFNGPLKRADPTENHVTSAQSRRPRRDPNIVKSSELAESKITHGRRKRLIGSSVLPSLMLWVDKRLTVPMRPLSVTRSATQ
jgi:hypothetical protein